jgi:hypothetical protein
MVGGGGSCHGTHSPPDDNWRVVPSQKKNVRFISPPIFVSGPENEPPAPEVSGNVSPLKLPPVLSCVIKDDNFFAQAKTRWPRNMPGSTRRKRRVKGKGKVGTEGGGSKNRGAGLIRG